MIAYNSIDISELATKQLGKFTVGVTNLDGLLVDVLFQAVEEFCCGPTEKCLILMRTVFNSGMVSFGSEMEAWRFYEIFESSDIINSGVYATLYSPTTGLVTESLK